MPEQQMSAHLTRLAKKRGRLPALVTAAGLGALIAVQSFVNSIIWYLRSTAYSVNSETESGLYELQNPAYTFQPSLDELLFYILPLVVGVFLALWVIAPISHELTLRFVLTRAILASGCAAILVIVVQALHGILTSLGAAFVVGDVVQSILDALSAGASSFVYSTPVVLFACVLLWLWLRDHPRDYEVAGLVDEL